MTSDYQWIVYVGNTDINRRTHFTTRIFNYYGEELVTLKDSFILQHNDSGRNTYRTIARIYNLDLSKYQPFRIYRRPKPKPKPINLGGYENGIRFDNRFNSNYRTFNNLNFRGRNIGSYIKTERKKYRTVYHFTNAKVITSEYLQYKTVKKRVKKIQQIKYGNQGGEIIRFSRPITLTSYTTIYERYYSHSTYDTYVNFKKDNRIPTKCCIKYLCNPQKYKKG